MEINRAYLSLGSNVGLCLEQLQRAYDLLKNKAQKHNHSKIYKTPPWGYDSDNDFLNCCIYLETKLDLPDFHRHCLAAEFALGKEKKTPDTYSDRPIDIDILFWNEGVLEDQGLTIPHPKLHLRNFVLLPLMDLNPDFIHPKFLLSVEELYLRCPDLSDIFLDEGELS